MTVSICPRIAFVADRQSIRKSGLRRNRAHLVRSKNFGYLEKGINSYVLTREEIRRAAYAGKSCALSLTKRSIERIEIDFSLYSSRCDLYLR